jgi:hypothetical protein
MQRAMKRRYLALLLVVGLAGCGSTANGGSHAAKNTPVPTTNTETKTASTVATTETTETAPQYEESTDAAVVEAGGSYGVAETATGVDYEKLDAAAQLEAVKAYLHSSIGSIRGKGVGPHALVAAIERFILKGNITDRLTTIIGEALFEIEGRERANTERQEGSRRHLLESRAAVGKNATEVERLLGKPEHTQEIGGEKLWYYEVPGPRQGEQTWQLVFSGSTVASENQY